MRRMIENKKWKRRGKMKNKKSKQRKRGKVGQ
jgi:hypothetical protein